MTTLLQLGVYKVSIGNIHTWWYSLKWITWTRIEKFTHQLYCITKERTDKTTQRTIRNVSLLIVPVSGLVSGREHKWTEDLLKIFPPLAFFLFFLARFLPEHDWQHKFWNLDFMKWLAVVHRQRSHHSILNAMMCLDIFSSFYACSFLAVGWLEKKSLGLHLDFSSSKRLVALIPKLPGDISFHFGPLTLP